MFLHLPAWPTISFAIKSIPEPYSSVPMLSTVNRRVNRMPVLDRSLDYRSFVSPGSGRVLFIRLFVVCTASRWMRRRNESAHAPDYSIKHQRMRRLVVSGTEGCLPLNNLHQTERFPFGTMKFNGFCRSNNRTKYEIVIMSRTGPRMFMRMRNILCPSWTELI